MLVILKWRVKDEKTTRKLWGFIDKRVSLVCLGIAAPLRDDVNIHYTFPIENSYLSVREKTPLCLSLLLFPTRYVASLLFIETSQEGTRCVWTLQLRLVLYYLYI